MNKELPWSLLLPAMVGTACCILAPIWGVGVWVAFLPGILLPLFVTCSVVRLMILAHVSCTWPNTLGKVVLSSMRKRVKFRNTPDSPAIYFEPIVHYQYKVGKETYIGNCVSFGSTRTISKQGRYKQGSSVSVFYNPKKPSIAVLQPGNPARLLPGLLLLLLLATSSTVAVILLYKLDI